MMRSIRFMSIWRGVAISACVALCNCAGAEAAIVGKFENGTFNWPNDIHPVFTGPGTVGVKLVGGQGFGPGDTATLGQGGAFSWSGKMTIFSSPSDTITNFTSNLTPGPNFNSGLITFCLELNQNIYPSQTNGPYDISNDLSTSPVGTGALTMGAIAAAYIGELWANHIDGTLINPSGDTLALSSPLDAGAFQLAIWKLEYDSGTGAIGFSSGNNTVSWGTGNLQVTSDTTLGNQSDPNNDAVALATQWIHDLTTPTGVYNASTNPGGNQADLLSLVSSTLQDQVFENFPNSGTNAVPPVPEPASLVTWLLIGSVAGSVRLRRGRKAAAA